VVKQKVLGAVLAGVFVPAVAFGQMVYMESNGSHCMSGECDWYVGVNANVNAWSWKNKYDTAYSGTNPDYSSDSYSFETVFGGSVVAGKYFNENIRGDIEIGLSSKFSDSDDGFDYSLSAAYIMVNGYYDFDFGLYVGGGIGIARSVTKLNSDTFDSTTDETNSSLDPKFGAAVGYAFNITDNVALDFRYRLSGFNVAGISRYFYQAGTENRFALTVKSDMLIENTLSAGVRYTF
jgi:opacity protein-like surface antigen